VVLENNLAVINLRNTFYIKNRKKTFLNFDFCNSEYSLTVLKLTTIVT